MNLASQTPAKQVVHILANLKPGAMPDLPPFLRVDAAEQARRNKWAADHPVEATKFMDRAPEHGRITNDADAVYRQRVAAERALAAERQKERFVALKQNKSQEWVMSLPEDERRWSTRLGRFIPECILGLERMRFVDALKAIENMAASETRKAKAPGHAAERRIAARVEQATTTRHARPVAPAPAAKAVGPRTVGKVTGADADIIVLEMLRRPEGVTQAQLAERLGSTGDAARGRISKNARAKNLSVKRTKEGVYRIA